MRRKRAGSRIKSVRIASERACPLLFASKQGGSRSRSAPFPPQRPQAFLPVRQRCPITGHAEQSGPDADVVLGACFSLAFFGVLSTFCRACDHGICLRPTAWVGTEKLTRIRALQVSNSPLVRGCRKRLALTEWAKPARLSAVSISARRRGSSSRASSAESACPADRRSRAGC